MKNRQVKPELLANEVLGVSDPNATILFMGLWMVADREGRFVWRPVWLKSQIFPYRDVKIEALLDFLVANNLLRRYEVEGKHYGMVTNFLEHQKIHPHEAKSKIPPPPNVDKCNYIPLHCNDVQSHTRFSSKVEVEVLEGSSKEEGSKSGIREGSLQPLPVAVVTPRTEKPQEPESVSPVWAGCAWFRLSERELVLAQDHYRKTGIGVEVIPFTIIEVENWLSGNTGKAKLARRSKTHLRQLYASWAIEKGVSLWQASNGGQKTVQGGLRPSVMYQTAAEKTTSMLQREAIRAHKLDERDANKRHDTQRHASTPDSNQAVLGFFPDRGGERKPAGG